MAQKTIQCRLITPTAKVLDEAVTYASLPAWDGLMGIMPSRGAMVAKLGIGELRLDFPDTDKSKGGSRSFLVEEGFAQIVDSKLTILAGKATPVESLVASDAEAELKTVLAKTATGADAAARALDAARIRTAQAVARAKVRLAKSGKGI